jgi:transcriptional regulator with XRE-family HTH domain
MESETVDDLLRPHLVTTWAALAARCRVSVRALHNLRHGLREPRPATVFAIAQRLGIGQARLAAAVEVSRKARA